MCAGAIDVGTVGTRVGVEATSEETVTSEGVAVTSDHVTSAG
jgi:hypothetical protein